MKEKNISKEYKTPLWVEILYPIVEEIERKKKEAPENETRS